MVNILNYFCGFVFLFCWSVEEKCFILIVICGVIFLFSIVFFCRVVGFICVEDVNIIFYNSELVGILNVVFLVWGSLGCIMGIKIINDF